MRYRSDEQLVRDLLSRAIEEGLVAPADVDPQCRSAGELIRLSNMLSEEFVRALRERDDRWQMAVGHDLEQAEEQADVCDPMAMYRKGGAR